MTVVVLKYLPDEIFTLEGQEGRLFGPLAFTKDIFLLDKLFNCVALKEPAHFIGKIGNGGTTRKGSCSFWGYVWYRTRYL